MNFEGYITGEAKDFLIKKIRKIISFSCILAAIGITPLLILISDFFSDYSFLWGMLGTFVFLAVIGVVFTPQLFKKDIPKRICIGDDVIVSECDSQKYCKSVESIKEICEYGSFYYFSFPIGQKSFNFICQKDLIVGGTVEEFEELFKDRIKRRNEE